jgi:hypothetical protein
MRSVASIAVLAGGLALLAPGAARAQATVAEIRAVPGPGLYRQDFSLVRDADVAVEAVGSGSRENEALIAYAWILDLGTGRPAWRMEAARSQATSREHNLRQGDSVRLPAGDYALYFTAFGGSFPIEKTIKLLKLFKLGTIEISGGNKVRWNEYGDPAEWGASVKLAAGTPADAIGPTPGATRPAAAVRLDRTGDNAYRAYRRAGLDLAAPIVFRVLAVGEYSSRDRGFADGAWIQERDGCRRLWEMNLTNTVPAGGAEKNRAFDGEVELAAGRYLVCYASDDSHAYEAWNSNPPYDPEAWGISLTPRVPPAPGAVTVTPNPPDENVVVRIDRVGDGEFRSEGFRLRRGTGLCVRGFGEWDARNNRYLDFGWIEDAYTLEKVWSMDPELGSYAAGESRNRLVEDQVRLEPGAYRVCYVSDEAHSFAGWHDHPPFEPESWGITVRGSQGFSPEWVSRLDAAGDEPTVIRLAPLGDDQDRRLRFDVPERITVRLIAVGEGERSEMFDYGWLEREAGGEPLWVMRYADTEHAGGAQKNRREQRILTLEPGRYALCFKTDDSHAFGTWNASPPSDPQLWGITLIEMRER